MNAYYYFTRRSLKYIKIPNYKISLKIVVFKFFESKFQPLEPWQEVQQSSVSSPHPSPEIQPPRNLHPSGVESVRKEGRKEANCCA